MNSNNALVELIYIRETWAMWYIYHIRAREIEIEFAEWSVSHSACFNFDNLLFTILPFVHKETTRIHRRRRRRKFQSNFLKIFFFFSNKTRCQPVVNHNGKQCWLWRAFVCLLLHLQLQPTAVKMTRKKSHKKYVRYVGHRTNQSRMCAKVSSKQKQRYILLFFFSSLQN